jgi:hypothetical protein
MQSAAYWQMLFENWPGSFPRQGIVITTQPDTIPFANFMITDGLLLLERDKPDSQGGRKVILSYESIAGVKFTTTVPTEEFSALGFREQV